MGHRRDRSESTVARSQLGWRGSLGLVALKPHQSAGLFPAVTLSSSLRGADPITRLLSRSSVWPRSVEHPTRMPVLSRFFNRGPVAPRSACPTLAVSVFEPSLSYHPCPLPSIHMSRLVCSACTSSSPERLSNLALALPGQLHITSQLTSRLSFD